MEEAVPEKGKGEEVRTPRGSNRDFQCPHALRSSEEVQFATLCSLASPLMESQPGRRAMVICHALAHPSEQLLEELVTAILDPAQDPQVSQSRYRPLNQSYSFFLQSPPTWLSNLSPLLGAPFPLLFLALHSSPLPGAPFPLPFLVLHSLSLVV